MKGASRLQVVFRVVPIAVIAMALGGCTDEKTVFVERVLFEDPPTAAQGFLGYDEEADKLTTCGNCHVGQQAKWKNTAHAHAWDTLQESGHAAALCENCHSVGPLGNPTDGDVGYAGTMADRYHDVQCESCHGAGLDHVTNPDARPRPIPSLKIFEVTAGDTAFFNCAECHQGTHHPFVEEWTQSLHATPLSSPAGRAECISCHTAQGALAAWGVQTEYEEKDAALGAHQLGIVCSVCHDPHGGPNTKQLRFPINVQDQNVHLCMKCHQRRSEPEFTAGSAVRGPHSPEGPLLLGDAGWWPPGFEQDKIETTHGSSVNEKLCVTCHVTRFAVNDPSSGVFQFQATGHLFQAIPCIGPDGKPQVGEVCEDINERSFVGCLGSGCHANEAVARSAYSASKDLVDDLVAEVDRLLHEPAAAAAIKADSLFTVAEGASFNRALGQLPGSSTHNPFLTRQLLMASIKALKDEYGLTVSSHIVLDPKYQ